MWYVEILNPRMCIVLFKMQQRCWRWKEPRGHTVTALRMSSTKVAGVADDVTVIKILLHPPAAAGAVPATFEVKPSLRRPMCPVRCIVCHSRGSQCASVSVCAVSMSPQLRRSSARTHVCACTCVSVHVCVCVYMCTCCTTRGGLWMAKLNSFYGYWVRNVTAQN